MAKLYDPADWYWLAEDGRLFSSARAALVAADAPAYLAWCADGSEPQRWPRDPDRAQTDAALVAVLEPHGLDFPGAELPAAALVAAANAHQWALATGGYVATIKGRAVAFSTSESAMGLMGDKVLRLAQPNAPASVNWQVGPIDFVAIAADDFVHAATLVSDFVQATFDALPSTFAAILAGTVRTRAAVAALPWPAPAGAVP